MMLSIYTTCALLLFAAGAAPAQQPPPQPDPIGENLFPPELVMQYQQAIGLSEEQRNLIKAEVQKAQARFTDLQWQLQSEAETMASLLKEPRPAQFTLVLRIKNGLTPEQQARLRELRNRQRTPPRE